MQSFRDSGWQWLCYLQYEAFKAVQNHYWYPATRRRRTWRSWEIGVVQVLTWHSSLSFTSIGSHGIAWRLLLGSSVPRKKRRTDLSGQLESFHSKSNRHFDLYITDVNSDILVKWISWEDITYPCMDQDKVQGHFIMHIWQWIIHKTKDLANIYKVVSSVSVPCAWNPVVVLFYWLSDRTVMNAQVGLYTTLKPTVMSLISKMG